MGIREVYVICKAEINTIENYRKKLTNPFNIAKQDEQNSTDNGIDHIIENDFDHIFISFCSYVKKVFGNMPYICGDICSLFKFPDDDDRKHNVLDQLRERNKIAMRMLAGDAENDRNSKLKEFLSFYARVQCIISLYETTYEQNEGSNGLDIRIPGTDNLTELKKYIESLEFVFTKCPFFQSNEESLKLRAVDNGSIWLIFSVVGVAGVSAVAVSQLMNNIAEFVKKCIEIKVYLHDIRKKEQLLKQSDLEQKEKEEILRSLNKLYKIAVKNAIKEMVGNTGCHLQDGDEQGRAEQSFERMVKLLDKGVQIHSAINSSEEVKALFEPLEKHYIEVGKKLDRIEEKLDIDTE